MSAGFTRDGADMLAARCVGYAKDVLVQFGRHGFSVTIVRGDGVPVVIARGNILDNAERAWMSGDAADAVALKASAAEKLRGLCAGVRAIGVICVMDRWLAEIGPGVENVGPCEDPAICVTWEMRLMNGGTVSGAQTVWYSKGDGGSIQILHEERDDMRSRGFPDVLPPPTVDVE